MERSSPAGIMHSQAITGWLFLCDETEAGAGVSQFSSGTSSSLLVQNILAVLLCCCLWLWWMGGVDFFTSHLYLSWCFLIFVSILFFSWNRKCLPFKKKSLSKHSPLQPGNGFAVLCAASSSCYSWNRSGLLIKVPDLCYAITIK